VLFDAVFVSPSHSGNVFLGVIINDEGPVLYGYDDCKPVSALYFNLLAILTV